MTQLISARPIRYSTMAPSTLRPTVVSVATTVVIVVSKVELLMAPELPPAPRENNARKSGCHRQAPRSAFCTKSCNLARISDGVRSPRPASTHPGSHDTGSGNARTHAARSQCETFSTGRLARPSYDAKNCSGASPPSSIHRATRQDAHPTSRGPPPPPPPRPRRPARPATQTRRAGEPLAVEERVTEVVVAMQQLVTAEVVRLDVAPH